MYKALLILHSILRWVVLLTAVIAIASNAAGWFGKKEWLPENRKLNAALVGTVDLNILLGLILYVGVSPLMKPIFADFGAAMKDAGLRFWAVEHMTGMILAAVVMHVASVMSKKADTDIAKFKRATIGFAFGLFIIFGSIPWPFREAVGRGLLPF